MTIKKQPTMIMCDYCNEVDYLYGNYAEVWTQAQKNGWFHYDGKHFDTKECMEQWKREHKNVR